MSLQLAPWAIWLLPVFSFLIISFVTRPFFNSRPKISGYITIAAIGLACLLSIWVFSTVAGSPKHRLEVPGFDWLTLGKLNVHIGLLVDGLTAVMLIVVTVVSLMVQIYSQGYMHGDPGYPRYYAFMSLFTAFMLGLVMADNLITLYLCWEGVGLCSYLLIGFWFHKPSAANAAKKAFIITRLGDVGLLVAVLLIFVNTGSMDIEQIKGLAVTGALSGAALTWIAIGIFAGAAGKSAQFPLHTWLPDAMEGPTPVSALIHAATMVAAGVFLVARMYPLFEHSHAAMTTVGVIGGFTAIFAASMGLVMNDIKRVLAYSTVSQLGYMMLGLAAGGVAVGIFHLFNHAFFKALLFLGSGSVNHASGTFDMRLMGGLRRHMPWTYATYLIASLSIAGIWPLAGFWSKDEILATSLSNMPVLGILAAVTAFMTAFYMFRSVFMTFHGEWKGGAPPEHGSDGNEHAHKPHESPAVMVAPLVILAFLSVSTGWLNLTGWFGSLLGHAEGGAHNWAEGLIGVFTHSYVPLLSLVLAGLGILLAWAMYCSRKISTETFSRPAPLLYKMLCRKYWMDELYEQIIVNRVLIDGFFRGLQWFDANVVDGAVNGIARVTWTAGAGLRRLQTGQLQVYGLAIGIGIVAITILFLYFGLR
jgi:NADH-quinone oxidoreductase subunit L